MSNKVSKPMGEALFFLLAAFFSFASWILLMIFVKDWSDRLGLLAFLSVVPALVGVGYFYVKSSERYFSQFGYRESESGVTANIPGLALSYERAGNIVTIREEGKPELRVCRSNFSLRSEKHTHSESGAIPRTSVTNVVGPGGAIYSGLTTDGYYTFDKEVVDGYSFGVEVVLGSVCKFGEEVDARGLSPARGQSWHWMINEKNESDLFPYKKNLTAFSDLTQGHSDVWVLENKDRIVREAKAFAEARVEANFRQVGDTLATLDCDQCLLDGDPASHLQEKIEVMMAWNAAQKDRFYFRNGGELVLCESAGTPAFRLKAAVDEKGQAKVEGIKAEFPDASAHFVLSLCSSPLSHFNGSRKVRKFDPQRDHAGILELVQTISAPVAVSKAPLPTVG